MVSSGRLRRVALVRTDVSEEFSASFIKVTRIDELGTMLAVTSNRRMLRRNTTCNLIDAIKEVGIEVNAEKSKYMLVSRYQNADKVGT
jgi:hypothetical protein